MMNHDLLRFCSEIVVGGSRFDISLLLCLFCEPLYSKRNWLYSKVVYSARGFAISKGAFRSFRDEAMPWETVASNINNPKYCSYVWVIERRHARLNQELPFRCILNEEYSWRIRVYEDSTATTYLRSNRMILALISWNKVVRYFNRRYRNDNIQALTRRSLTVRLIIRQINK